MWLPCFSRPPAVAGAADDFRTERGDRVSRTTIGTETKGFSSTHTHQLLRTCIDNCNECCKGNFPIADSRNPRLRVSEVICSRFQAEMAGIRWAVLPPVAATGGHWRQAGSVPWQQKHKAPELVQRMCQRSSETKCAAVRARLRGCQS